MNMGLSNNNQNWGFLLFLVGGSILFMVLILLYVFAVLDPSLKWW